MALVILFQITVTMGLTIEMKVAFKCSTKARPIVTYFLIPMGGYGPEIPTVGDF